MATLDERIAQIETTIAATAGAPPEVQAAAIAAIVPPPTGEGVNRLWMTLIAGFLVLLLVSLAGVLYLLIDEKEADVAVTVFTALLTGILGLFAPSPATGGGNT